MSANSPYGRLVGGRGMRVSGNPASPVIRSRPVGPQIRGAEVRPYQ
jgi:hypothetical protein